MKTVIVDDEQKQREVIKQLFNKYCQGINLVGEADSVEKAYKLIKKETPDLVFLDVEMPHGSGFDLLRKFNQIDFEFIFVTGFGHYAIKAFEFNALHFIQKPVDDLKIVKAIEKARERALEKERFLHYKIMLENLKRPKEGALENQIIIPHQDGYEFIEVQDIIHCEADGSSTSIYTKSGKRIFSSKNLRKFEEILLDYDFFRIHNSHLINLKCIQKYLKQDGGIVVLTNDTAIPISRRKKDEFLKVFESKL